MILSLDLCVSERFRHQIVLVSHSHMVENKEAELCGRTYDDRLELIAGESWCIETIDSILAERSGFKKVLQVVGQVTSILGCRQRIVGRRLAWWSTGLGAS